MKNLFFMTSAIVMLTMITASTQAQTSTKADEANLVQYVDPYIGAGEHGHVFVGANVPFGMIQAGPQNIHKGWDWCSGYHYSDSLIIGFSHTHLSGTGCADMGDILLMPYTGSLRTGRGEQNYLGGAASCYYKHENESVSPGYYSLLMDNGVKDEITATDRAAIHHITYPADQTARLLINLKDGNSAIVFESHIEKIDDYTIVGYRYTHGWSPTRKVYFCLKSNQPIASFDVFNDDAEASGDKLTGTGVKGVITFKGIKETYVKLALSSVSCENATNNLTSEIPEWDFAGVLKSARDRWNAHLSKIIISTPSIKAKKIFYTAMYHIAIAPTLYEDVNKQFRGHNDKIYTTDSWTNYSTFSLWDTYRTLNPLYTIISPSKTADWVNSFLSIYEQQGKLPIWPLWGGETECMPGYSAVPIIADAFLKGIKGFDAQRAFTDMVSSATNDRQKGVTFVKTKGYIPCDKIHEATSIAMEYAADDWGIALMAKKLGNKADYKTFLKRGHYYEKYFDKSINFIRPVMDDGSWRTPYSPFRSIHGVGDFTEGTGWQYTFFVPQHPEGLIALMGGDEVFGTKLDSLFNVHGDMGKGASNDITGLIGQYAHGNEPSHHVAYLYPYAGQQWKTAEKVRFIQREFYTDKPDGIIGNEDCGQMSAWHVLSALGFYQVNPSNGVYVFGSPLFDKAVINLENGKTFTVTAKGNSDTNIYIQSATLNGKPYKKSFISYTNIMAGGELTFVMGPTPNKRFGAAKADRPVTAE